MRVLFTNAGAHTHSFLHRFMPARRITAVGSAVH
jgi:hypothetical protein